MTDIDIAKRHFIGPDGETVYYIQPPTADDVRKADWQYSKIYTQCLIEGITTQAEMMDILTRRGIIGPEFEQRLTELNNDLLDKIDMLRSATAMEEKERLANEVSRARNEMYKWNQRLTGPMNNSAEQISDNARLEYLTSSMTTDYEGKRVWASYDRYLEDKSQNMSMKALYEVMLYLQGLASDFLEHTPEAKAMKDIEQDILAKTEALAKAEDAVAKEEAEEEVEAKPQDEAVVEANPETTVESEDAAMKKGQGQKKNK